MDFLEMTDPNQGVELFGQWIPRARLGLHLRLSKIYARVTFDDAPETATAIKEYLDLCGLDDTDLTGLEQLQAVLILVEINRLQTVFAYQKWKGPDQKEPPYTYSGRIWALYIHKIASRYGWTRDEIFNLWPEEAAAYIQEIILAEYDEADERRALTEIGYKYDQATKKSRFIPVPRPGWMVDEAPEKSRRLRVRRDMLPMGNIIDLTNKTNDDFTLH